MGTLLHGLKQQHRLRQYGQLDRNGRIGRIIGKGVSGWMMGEDLGGLGGLNRFLESFTTRAHRTPVLSKNQYDPPYAPSIVVNQ
jgi:hypothetical protein